MIKKLFAKTDSLMDKVLYCPRTNLPNSMNLILDGVKTKVLLSNFAQQLGRKNEDVRDIHFTLLDAAGLSPTLVLNQSAKAKEKEIGSLLKNARQKLQNFFTHGGAVFGFVRNLVKLGNLPVSKARQFSDSKLSYTKFTLAMPNFKKLGQLPY